MMCTVPVSQTGGPQWRGNVDRAELDERQLALIIEAEQTLGSNHILAYRRTDKAHASGVDVNLRPAALNPSQLECLLGVEQLVGCVAVAYAR